MCVFRLEQVVVHVGCMSIKDSQELVSTLLNIPFYSHALSASFMHIPLFLMHLSIFITAVLHIYISSHLFPWLSIRVSARSDKQLVLSSWLCKNADWMFFTFLQARHAASIGADAIAVISPSYFKPINAGFNPLFLNST